MAARSGFRQDSPENEVFSSPGDDLDLTIKRLEDTIERASDLLIYREFEKCLSFCSNAIHKIGISSSHQSYVNSLCILMIQSYAELDQWTTVIPLIQDIYGSIENCPVRIIQICLLLHVKVKEYIRCHAIARSWLQCEQNRHHQEYCQVAKLYVHQVLVPLGALNLIPQFVDTCSGLSPLDKEALLSPIKTSVPLPSITSGETTQSQNDFSDGDKDNLEPQNRKRRVSQLDLLCSLRRVSRRFFRRMSRIHLPPAFRVMFLLTLAAIALVNSFNSDMVTGYGRLMTMWMSLSKLLTISSSSKTA